MKESTAFQSAKDISPRGLWKKIHGSDIPIVSWQLPNDSTRLTLLDLNFDENPTKREIETLPAGFLINPFEQTHPPKPYFIKADIVITSTKDGWDHSVDPSVAARDLDRLEQTLSAPASEMYEAPDTFDAHEHYLDLVERSLGMIEKSQFQKVVLSRFEDHPLPADLDIYERFNRLCVQYPNALKYAFYLPGIGTWLGATPEELMTITDNRYFRTVALAGTQPFKDDDDLAEVAWKQKEIEEQAMVSRYIIECFKKIRLREFTEQGPRTAKAGNLAHLKTEFFVDMTDTNSPLLGTTMLELLHPTSAVCGMPLDASLRFIRENEGYQRQFYAGFLGPVNFENNTSLFVNLRCMQLLKEKGRFYAGAGITKGSKPEKELEETLLKLQTMKNVMLAD